MTDRMCLQRPPRDRTLLLTAIALAALLSGTAPCHAQEKEADGKQNGRPPAQFLTVSSPVDDAVFGKVKNTALSLQQEADERDRKAYLVLEITPGSSPFHQVQGLAKFLTSSDVSRVKTLAWIPKTVTGNKVVLALACNEIVMHPDAELGDIGRGKPVEGVDRQFVIGLVEKRHNPQLNRALALGMLDPGQVVLKVRVRSNGETVTRLATQTELKRMQEAGTHIPDPPVTVKEAGDLGTFSGREADSLGILTAAVVESRAGIVELYNLPRESMREPQVDEPQVRLIKVDDVIDPVLASFVERQIQRAVESGANTLIFEINSYGGMLLPAQKLAFTIAELESQDVRTVAYVPEKAISAAAMIALGCDEIYMKAGAEIGDAAPLEVRPGQQMERAPEKVLSLLRRWLRELAEKKGRPAALAEAMADQSLQVYRVTHRKTGRVWYVGENELGADGKWIKEQLVHESRKGNVLTIGAERAHELKLVEPPVADRDELKERLGVPPNVTLHAIGRTWVDTLVFVLNTKGAMFALVVLGIIFIYLELHLMTGLLGILSVLCFSLFFWSRFLGGTAVWLDVILFLLGLGCLLIEVLVIPGFGVFGISGGLLVLASLIMASQTFNNIVPGRDLETLSKNVGVLSGSLITVAVTAFLLSRFLPSMPLLNQMILTPPALAGGPDPSEPQLRPEDVGGTSTLIEKDRSLVGRHGRTLSVLRPAGKAEIDGHYVDVVSDGPFIPAGSNVEVTSVSGSRVVVRQV